MRLARKLIFAIVSSIILVMWIQAYLRIIREGDFLLRDTHKDHWIMARSLAPAVQEAWENGGVEVVYDLVFRANQRESDVQIRWVWLRGLSADGHAPQAPLSEVSHLQNRERSSWSARARGGDTDLCTYYGVQLDAQVAGALEVCESLKGRRDYLRITAIRNAAFAVLLVVLCTALVIAIGIYWVGRPVALLIDQARRVGAGDLSQRIVLNQGDELGELAEEMNAMCDRLQEANARIAAETEARIAVLQQLRHADRLMTVGKLASGLAHELGTPLNVVGARGKMIASGEVEGAEARDNGRIIHEQTARMAAIIRQLLDFARPRTPSRAHTRLAHVVQRTFELLEPMARKRGVELVLLEVEAPYSSIDPGQIQQVLTNLLVNALHASRDGQRVTVTLEDVTAQAPPEPGGSNTAWTRLVVQDEGVGIAAEHMERLFEPFFTTRDVGVGTGLGLAVAWGIVHEHGGWIEVRSRAGEGATFAVFLPRSVESAGEA